MAPAKASATVLAVLLVSGCAGSPSPEAYAIAGGGSGAAVVSSPLSAQQGGPAAYVLNDEEKGAGCKRLTGRMKIRILQIKDYDTRSKSTELAHSLHTAQSQFGASGAGANSDEEYRQSRAMLEAYNGELQKRGCATLDLAKELAPSP